MTQYIKLYILYIINIIINIFITIVLSPLFIYSFITFILFYLLDKKKLWKNSRIRTLLSSRSRRAWCYAAPQWLRFDIHCQYWKSTVHVTYTIDFQYWQWMSKHSLEGVL